MPFESSFIDPERGLPPDSREFFARLAPLVVREPISTDIIKTTTKNGRRRYLVVDRAHRPEEGDLIVVAGRYRHKLARYVPTIAQHVIYGTVLWVLQEGM